MYQKIVNKVYSKNSTKPRITSMSLWTNIRSKYFMTQLP